MEQNLSELVYLVCIVLFVIGLKGLSHPETARKGNLQAAAGMVGAILMTLVMPLEDSHGNYAWIGGGVVVGSVVGLTAARRVAMTAMPEMVSLFNGLGGACAMFIALVELSRIPADAAPFSGGSLSAVLALFIGSLSFTGSLVAYGKLNGSLRDTVKVPAPSIVNALLLLGVIGLSVYFFMQPAPDMTLVYSLLALSLVYGFTFVTPIGGGDMPVVISLLNSFTGLGAAFAGLVYGNQVMLVGGILVGASGTFLTVLMCKAMNRSLFNVIVGGFAASGAAAGTDREQAVKEATVADLSIELKYAGRVVVVPGYGMAVAQAQHIVHELESALEEEGVEVRYAIHPVAGRMPGHMNVLLAEADVPYDRLLELEEANKMMPQTDVVLIVGANDVVNPAAQEDPSSSIYGMPIIEVEQAQKVVVLKRSMRTGYAGIQNQLFFGERTQMLFGDAKASLKSLKDGVEEA